MDGKLEGRLRPRYAEIAELRRLQATLDRPYVDIRVPPTEAVARMLGSIARPDPTFPPPSTFAPDLGRIDLNRLQSILRTFLDSLPGDDDGPREEMTRLLRTWCEARERLASRLGGRG